MRSERPVVAWRNPRLSYPAHSPFDPECLYPEYPFTDESVYEENHIYGAVREVLHEAGLDKSHYGIPRWNPLADLVGERGTVLIKPNWVRHYHLRGEDIFSLITHPSVLRPLVDYAFKAVGPHGRIWVMDAPLFDTDYSVLRDICQLDDMEATLRARGVPLTVADMRSLSVQTDRGVVIKRKTIDSWASEGIEFDLGPDSEFTGLGPHLRNIFGSDYDRRVTVAFHAMTNGRQRHCYRISRRSLEADLVISVPKLKTHKKTGVSLNIKNMIGINTDKNYIPHYRVGSPSQGGDEFPDSTSLSKRLRRSFVRHSIDITLGRFGHAGERLAHAFMTLWMTLSKSRSEKKAGQKLDPIDVFYRTVQGDRFRTGNWWGNDTCWRSGLDINKILLYGTVEGLLADHPMRQYFSLIDGIVAGDEDGPLAPTPRAEGVLIAGFDPVAVDRVATRIMGFDPDLIRDLFCGARLAKYPLTNSNLPIRVCSNWPGWQGDIKPGSDLDFRAHDAWTEYLQNSR
jgi:uncharacterized protein (DUF362 family)